MDAANPHPESPQAIAHRVGLLCIALTTPPYHKFKDKKGIAQALGVSQSLLSQYSSEKNPTQIPHHVVTAMLRAPFGFDAYRYIYSGGKETLPHWLVLALDKAERELPSKR